MMSEHEKETAFLRQLMLYDDSEGRRKLGENVAQVLRDERCVRRVASVTAVFPLLALVGLAYGVILEGSNPNRGAELIIRVLCELGLASLICLLAFGGLLIAYRRRLNRLRGECRQLFTRFLDSHLGKPQGATSPRNKTGVPSNDALANSMLSATNPGPNTDSGALTA